MALGAVLVVAAMLVGAVAPPAGAAGSGSISGIVTATSGGAPLRGICVSAHHTDVDSTLIRTTTTAANGRYTLTNLPAGNVTVQFVDTGLCLAGVAGNYVGEWYNNQPTLTTAKTIAVAAGATKANVNAALSVGGTVTGTVTAAAGGAPLHRICVGAYMKGNPPRLLSSTATAVNGTYRLTGLPPGKVLIQFFATGVCPGGAVENYVEQWFNDKLIPATAAFVSVTARATRPGINASLVAGGTISGIVHAAGANGAALFGICVAAYSPSADGVLVGSTGTQRNGRYTLRGIPAGDVRVQFSAHGACPGGVVQRFATQWFGNKPTFTTADPVIVVPGATNANINASMIALLSVPGSPGNVHASKPSATTAIVTWSPPSSTGGAPITGYDVTFGGTPVHVSASARRATIANLARGTYHFRVRAINKVGPGAYSAPSNAVNIR